MSSITENRIRYLHHKLTSSGIDPGTKIPRRPWDELIVRAFKVGHMQAKNITRDGDLLGYWIRHPHHGPQQGSIELLDRRQDTPDPLI